MGEAVANTADEGGSQPCLLLVVDDGTNLQALYETLEGRGYKLLVARDGEGALGVAAKALPDLILLDLKTSGMDGFDAIQKLKADPETRDIPVVFLTAVNETRDRVKGLDLGAVDYVTKPFHSEEVLARVQMHLTIRGLQRSLSQRNRELEEADRKMKTDLDAAARVQQSLLPTEEPQVEGLRFAWHYQPCLALAGDSLGVLPIDDRNVAIYVLDVSGHGVSSALLSVAVTRSLALKSDPAALVSLPGVAGAGDRVRRPSEVADRLNRLYPMSANGQHYFTLTYGLVDPTNGRFEFVSPGNPGPILARPGEPPRTFDRPAVPIGMFEESQYEDSVIQLEPGDRLYLHSDGLNEERNAAGEEFGRDRLLERIESVSGLPFEEGLRAVAQTVRDWRGAHACRDDVALLGVQYRG